MRSRRNHPLTDLAAALKIIAFVALYLVGLSLLPPVSRAYRALDDAHRMIVAFAQEPASEPAGPYSAR
jgi:hypothetical protein